MRSLPICASVLSALLFQLYGAEPEEMWISCFPSAGESVIWDSAETPGGNVFSVGEAWTGTDCGTALNIAVLKPDGSILVERTSLSMMNSAGFSTVFHDNSFFICGVVCDSSSSDGFIMRTDTLGNRIWLTTEGYDGDDAFTDMCVTPDGKIVAVGYSYNCETRDREVFAACFSDSGSVLWRKRYMETGYQTAAALARENGDGEGFLITGTDGTDVFLMKIADNGDWEWKTKYFQDGMQTAYDILPVSGGGYLVTGSTRSEAQFSDALIVFFDEEGKVSSFVSWGEAGPDIAHSAISMPPAGFVILVNSNKADGNGYRPVLTRFDPWFSKLWQVELVDNDAICYSVTATSDGGFLVSGKQASADSSSMHVSCVIRLSPEDLLNWD